jgi:hypothetical protein
LPTGEKSVEIIFFKKKDCRSSAIAPRLYTGAPVAAPGRGYVAPNSRPSDRRHPAGRKHPGRRVDVFQKGPLLSPESTRGPERPSVYSKYVGLFFVPTLVL